MVAPQPFFRPRGTPFSVLHRIRALVEQGHSVDLVTYPFGEDVDLPNLKIIRSAKPPLIKDVKIGPSASKLLLDIPLFFTTRRLIASGQYDVVHTHEEAAFFGTPLSKRHSVPHIYDMHSSLAQQLENFKSYNVSIFRNLFKKLERYVIENSHGVITICPELAETAKPLCDGIPHSMIENTGDDRKIFGTSRRDVRGEFGLRDKLVVLYTGTLEKYQGIDLLVHAMAKLTRDRSNIHLLLVGGTDIQIEHYTAMAADLGISEEVTFTGMVPPMDIPSFIESADLIASPRISGTNTPLKIYGYLRSGKPIVATNLATHTQVLTPSVAMLVDPDVDKFADAIRRLADSPDERRKLAAAAADLSEKDFSDSEYTEKVVEFYSQVMHEAAA